MPFTETSVFLLFSFFLFAISAVHRKLRNLHKHQGVNLTVYIFYGPTFTTACSYGGHKSGYLVARLTSLLFHIQFVLTIISYRVQSPLQSIYNPKKSDILHAFNLLTVNYYCEISCNSHDFGLLDAQGETKLLTFLYLPGFRLQKYDWLLWITALHAIIELCSKKSVSILLILQ